jgi:hypothetical protein
MDWSLRVEARQHYECVAVTERRVLVECCCGTFEATPDGNQRPSDRHAY